MSTKSFSWNKSKQSQAQDKLATDVELTEHTWEIERICEFYHTSKDVGLTPDQVVLNRNEYGENKLTPPKKTPLWVKFLEQFTNFFSLLLLAGSILCFIGFSIDPEKDEVNLYLGIVLGAVVLITCTFSFYQEAQSDSIMEGFKDMIPRKSKVIRSTGTQIVEATEVVKGDLVELNEGDQVPADVRVISANELHVDNASLTGEAEPQQRTGEIEKVVDGRPPPVMEAKNIAFYGTIISSGAGLGIVVGIGDNTAMGQIANLTTGQEKKRTPINEEIRKFILLISAIAITLGVTLFGIGFAQTTFIKNIVFAIGIIVANVPEGLLATVTVSLALTAKRMSHRKVLVKHLEAVETLGSTTVIASDKTGTLTQNRMTVQHTWYDDKILDVPAARNKKEYDSMCQKQKGKMYDPEAPTFKILHAIGAVCNNSKFLVTEEDPTPVAEGWVKDDYNMLDVTCSSDASETGLVKALQPIRDVAEFRAANPKVFEIKFNSTNKWMCSIHDMEKGFGMDRVLLLKGAPERVIRMCKTICINGQKVELTKEWKEKFQNAYESLGGLGERVLGFAYRDMKDQPKDKEYTSKPEPNFPLDDLTFAGLFTLIDPPRIGVPEAVGKCKRGGIKVFMVTGDHPITAEAIAKQVGIIDPSGGASIVIKGDDIRDLTELSEQEQEKKWDFWLSHKQIVFARVSPKHKLIICDAAQKRGEIVAVTGDGVNDAPALSAAHIGVAMGIMGKDVAKEAADMILMDDNFASIVNGVEEGRLIFDNLKKSISYTLTSNIPEIGPFIMYMLLNIPLPLSTVLILCVDLGTDMWPAISLAYEEKESDIMDRPPRNAATDRLVNRRLITFAYFQIGIMQVLAGFFTYLIVLNDYGYSPRILMGLGADWEDAPVMCTVKGNGAPGACGFGCGEPKFDNVGYGKVEGDRKWCEDGCPIPGYGYADPFVESTFDGFRGFDAGEEAVCGRTCAWFYTQGNSTGNTFEDSLFSQYCALEPAGTRYGFPERKKASSTASSKKAEAGAFYWWNGRPQRFPNKEYQSNALAYAQTAYFISIIVAQWSDLLISKTRKLSLFEQGMHNSKMIQGLLFETCLGIFLCYCPGFDTGLGTRPIHGFHWFLGVPWSLLILIYDEVRKMIIRDNPGGWTDRFTYW